MPPVAATENRKHYRVLDESGIAVKIIREDGNARRENTIFRLTTDISKGGLRFRTSRKLAEKTRLRIHVALREPLKTVTHVGIVRWIKETSPSRYEVGVEFAGSGEMDEILWSHYLDTRLLGHN